MPSTLSFMSAQFTLFNKKEILQEIQNASLENPVRVATLNPEFILEAQRNLPFRAVLRKMACIIDGNGLQIALRSLVGVPTELYHGADLVHDLFTTYQDGSKRFYLLGDKPGVAQKAQSELLKLFPNLKVIGAEDGGRIDPAHVIIDEGIKKRILENKTDILIVGFGAPKQELWIDAAWNLSIPVMIGAGGTFGFYGTKRRAPRAWSVLRLEWLYRSLTEKGHARRAFKAAIIFPLRAIFWRVIHWEPVTQAQQ